jgi:hypothetical protein
VENRGAIGLKIVSILYAIANARKLSGFLSGFGWHLPCTASYGLQTLSQFANRTANSGKREGMEEEMQKTRLIAKSMCLTVLAFASVTALAASKEGIVTINGAKQTVLMNGQSDFHPAGQHSAKLKTFYSNLGTGNDVYDSGEGWTISGDDSEVGTEYWLAMPWRKLADGCDCIITQIDVAIGYVAGTNAVVIGLAADDHGLPGKTLKSWTFKNMYPFGDCCTLDTVKTKGIKIKIKTQYWVTVTTNANDATLWGAWNLTYNGATGPFAYQVNQGGWQGANNTLGAFDVLGR